METRALLDEFSASVCAHDGERFARLFTEDGTYADIFYGKHSGRQEIAAMVNDRFYEFADDFRWQMLDPVRQGDTIYTRCIFSYVSKFPDAVKPRVVMESVTILKLRDGLIHEYAEVVNNGPALLELGFSPDKTARILRRQSEALRARDEVKPHLK